MRESGGTKSRATTSVASLSPGDVVQVRLVERERQGKSTGELIARRWCRRALVSMELKTGQVRVLMGGKDFGDSTFNRATQARRQPGSAFKPVLYAAAVEKGFRAGFHVGGLPPFSAGGRHGQLWSPQNYDHRFYGPISDGPLVNSPQHARRLFVCA